MSVTAFNRQLREMANKKVTKVTEVTKVINYEEMTKAEIAEKLSALGIDFDARKNKESLIELLKAGE
jgi:hypothetical protein